MYLHVRRMSLGDSADQFERPEGIKALAVVFAELLAVLLFRNLPHSLQEIATRRAMGVDIEDTFSFRQMLLREGQNLFGKGAVIDTRSKADAVIGGQVRIRLGNDIDQSDIVFCGNGVQQLFVLP